MDADTCVLCGANAAAEKFYLNPAFSALPEAVKEELRTLCVLFVADVGGTLLLVFDEEGNLQLQTLPEAGGAGFDDIGAEYKIRKMQREQAELFGQLETYFRAVFLSEEDERENR